MTTIGIPPRTQDDWDVPAADVAAEAKRQAALRLLHPSPDRLRELAEHPVHADAAHLAEYSHLLHDADPDSTVPPFVDLNKGTPWRTS